MALLPLASSIQIYNRGKKKVKQGGQFLIFGCLASMGSDLGGENPPTSFDPNLVRFLVPAGRNFRIG